MRKVYVEITTRLIIVTDEGAEISKIIDEMDYNFSDTTGKADIIDTKILDYVIKDSK